MILGVDIGGSHISTALVDEDNSRIIEGSFCKQEINAAANADDIISRWVKAMNISLSKSGNGTPNSIGIAMPGPFDYENGICLIEGVSKYQSLYGVNVRQALLDELKLDDKTPIVFENDAACFGLGEQANKCNESYRKLIAITLGTGFGATFVNEGIIINEGDEVPVGGVLFNHPYRDGIAEDIISARSLIKRYKELTGKQLVEVKEIADAAITCCDAFAKQVFSELGYHLACCLSPWIQSFKADCLVIGGNIAKASPLFLPGLQAEFARQDIDIPIQISERMEESAIVGATIVAEQKASMKKEDVWRLSSQPLLPQHLNIDTENKDYDIYPFRRLISGSIQSGYASLADWMAKHKAVIIDGFAGNDWNFIRQKLSRCFIEKGLRVLWFEASAYLQPEQQTEAMAAPFLGDKNDVWGEKTTLLLADFFRLEKLHSLQPDENFDINIIIGTGAALCDWTTPVIYIDLPKNELQYRMRAGSAGNLGNQIEDDSYANKYKRLYFVDWVVLNKHRQQIKNRIAIIADGQWRDDINWALSSAVEKGLYEAAHNAIRVRPWFEAGAWGGQWMKKHIPALNQNEINYAWSFELIVPENGLVFESDSNLLEVAFDWLMESQPEAILGADAARFGLEFPIRFDFLDTVEGGNLSIQCHPRLAYIQEHLGETITQDETYYILDCEEEASVYLGFQEDINPDEFKYELERSNVDNISLDIERFVQRHKANKHDLFLIPNGTIHSSGAGNMVLEISAMPYIFTFKMYDWLRLDLNGKPRPININRAFNNLDFSRKGEVVQQELISKPYVLQKEDGYQIVHLPTHKEHFYDVHRIEFTDRVTIPTENKFHVMMLVEGTSITVITEKGERHRFRYAETFIIPAAAGSFEMINEGKDTAKVIQAFVK